MLTPKALQKALAQSALQAHKLAAAFDMTVPGIKPKSSDKAKNRVKFFISGSASKPRGVFCSVFNSCLRTSSMR